MSEEEPIEIKVPLIKGHSHEEAIEQSQKANEGHRGEILINYDVFSRPVTQEGVFITNELNETNMSEDLQAKFLADKCEDIADSITNLEECKKLRSEFGVALRKAGCKCKHKGIRASFLNRFKKLIKD